jgi:hypothetical protein
MNASDTLLILVGLLVGFVTGYGWAWRFARKLERHNVVLADWDQPYDVHAPKSGRVFPLDRSQR